LPPLTQRNIFVYIIAAPPRSNWTYNTHKQSSHLVAYHQNEDQVHVNSNKTFKKTGKSNFESHELLLSPLSLEEYYPAVAINALVNILTNPMLKSHHKQAVNLVSKVCTQLFATKSVPLIEELINCCINGISNDDSYTHGDDDSGKVLKEYFNLLRLLITSVEEKIQPYLGQIVYCIDDFWSSPHLEEVLKLVECIHHVLSPYDCFKNLLPDLLPTMIEVIQNDFIEDDVERTKVLNTLAKIGPSLGEYTRNVVPIITKILDRNRTLYNSASTSSRSNAMQDRKTELSKLCIKVMMHITKSNESHTSQFSSQMIHVLVRVVAKYEGTAKDLQTLAMQGLCQMVCRLGPQFVPYILPIKASLGSVSTQYDNIYHSLVMKAVKGKTMKPYPKEAEVHAPDDWKKGVAEGGDDKDKVLGECLKRKGLGTERPARSLPPLDWRVHPHR
jgi:serine/threonine-protein kinase mTOR